MRPADLFPEGWACDMKAGANFFGVEPKNGVDDGI
jgi:hypothetical protein